MPQAQISNLAHKAAFRLEFYKGEQVRSVWDRAKPSIQKALDRGSNYTIDQVYDGLLISEMQLWLWDDSALITALQVNKLGKKFCLLLALGGERMSDWFQYLPLVEDWAKDEGAEEVRIYGRIGWARMTGYDIEYTKMVKKL